jgi:hypothetical protein
VTLHVFTTKIYQHNMSEKKSTGWQGWLIAIGLLLIVVGVLLPIIGMRDDMFKWVYAAGALIGLVGRLFNKAPEDVPMRVKRLLRIEAWSAIFFCVGAFFMFYPGSNTADWLAFTLAGGAVLIYTSIMIPLAMRKG